MATILDLLMALNRDDLPPIPAPARPVALTTAGQPTPPEYGGPSMVTEVPAAPLDTRIIQQMLALRGPAPTAPAPLSRGQRIANALMGFGAGVQGYGPQFLEQLQQPQREYQRQLGAYNNLGVELGARGLETAQRQQEQKTRRAQEVSDQQFQAEVNRETRRLRLTDDREKALFEDLLAARRQRERDERLAVENQRKEKALLRRQVDLQMDDRIKAYRDQGAKQEYAEELARNDFRRALTDLGETVPPLSKAAEKANVLVQARLQRALRLAQGGSGGGDAKLAEQFENLKRQLYPARERGDTEAENSIMRHIEAVGSKLQAKGFEVGYGDNPYQRPPQARTAQPTAQAAGPVGDEVKAYARRFNISEKQARKELTGQ